MTYLPKDITELAVGHRKCRIQKVLAFGNLEVRAAGAITTKSCSTGEHLTSHKNEQVCGVAIVDIARFIDQELIIVRGCIVILGIEAVGLCLIEDIRDDEQLQGDGGVLFLELCDGLLGHRSCARQPRCPYRFAKVR
jgi:hypothetical protein